MKWIISQVLISIARDQYNWTRSRHCMAPCADRRLLWAICWFWFSTLLIIFNIPATGDFCSAKGEVWCSFFGTLNSCSSPISEAYSPWLSAFRHTTADSVSCCYSYLEPLFTCRYGTMYKVNVFLKIQFPFSSWDTQGKRYMVASSSSP